MVTQPSHDAEEARDALTGLPGTEAVRMRLAEWRAGRAAAGEAAPIHALLLGLRRFDAVNLAYGAGAGDALLAEVALRLLHFAGDELDGAFIATRASGGNFLLIANEPCSRERWQLFADQLADAIARPTMITGETLRLSPRLALLRATADESLSSMLDRLGQALDTARGQQGRRLVWADGEVVRPGHSTARLEADLLRAIEGEEIEILFQPQYALHTDSLTGAEALARWNHPELGRIGAGTLFALAERADHVAPLSQHIARRALDEARTWRAGLRLSLNVTPADLAAASYASQLSAIVAECGFPAERLTLEVTEQALLGDIHMVQWTLRELVRCGIRIALDDFGAGFCNFRYLKLLPLHYLKLDRTMIEGITVDPRDLAVFRAIVAMADSLDLQVIVEGVETEAQRALVAAENCAFYQGFLRARPMSGPRFADLARSYG
ncbi:MAG: bifunctional diguanylate cyclase/phosphodiesterase [Novosphingobium sp.]